MTHSQSLDKEVVEKVVALIDDFRSRHVNVVLLLEWLMPRQERLVPMKRKGVPIIARIKMDFRYPSTYLHVDNFSSKLWCMQNRFDYHGISIAPALIRVRVDYLLENGVRLPVKDDGIVCAAWRLAEGDTVTVSKVQEHVFTRLLSLYGHSDKVLIRHLQAATSHPLIGADMPVMSPGLECGRTEVIYEGNESLWLDSIFESMFSALRVAPDPEGPVVSILSNLLRMLGTYTKMANRSIRSALRPMRLKPNGSLVTIPKFTELRGYLQDALFSWSTETFSHQVRGEVSVAPQTRFGWCTKNYVVVLDYRLDRLTHDLQLLPSCVLVAIDRQRDLGYLVSVNQDEDFIHVDACFRMVDVKSPQNMASLLTLTNLRFALPHQFDPEIEDNGLARQVEAPLPLWFDRTLSFHYDVLNVSDLYRMRFEFRLLPEDFDRYIREVMLMFYHAALRGFRLRVRLGEEDTEGTLVEIRHPAQIGIACANDLAGQHLRSFSWLWNKWMSMAFRVRTTPWHVLAWRFLDCAKCAGLKDFFGRRLWEIDRHMASVMFGQRTILSYRNGSVISIVRYPYYLNKGNNEVIQVPARYLGRKFVMSLDEFRKHVLEFDPERFALTHKATESMLELILDG